MTRFRSILLTVLLSVISASGSIELCSDNYLGVNFYQNVGYKNCGCDNNCIRKCCKHGFRYNESNDTCYRNDSAKKFEVPVYTNKTKFLARTTTIENFMIGVINCTPYILIKLRRREKFFVQKDGKLWVPLQEQYFTNFEYCLDEGNETIAYVCYHETAASVLGRRIVVIGMLVSLPFLLATFLVYAILPDRNLHQKALMFYVLSLLLAYICLVSIQLSDKLEGGACDFMGFITIFFFLVSFFWMNVICLDIWFTFSGFRGFIGSNRESERKRFYLYCGYAWGIPAIFVAIVFIINTFGDVNSIYHPGVGIGKCFVNDGMPSLLYFNGPMTILITINIILFALTAFKIRQVKKETSMLKQNDSKKHAYEKNKQKFNLYLKLLFAMGVNWSMECISWAVNWKTGNNVPEEIWYLTDFCNALYGVFIFFIFVFKKKIWRLLQKRYYTFIGKPHLAHTLNTTVTTRTSNYSSSVVDTNIDGNNTRRNAEEIALNQR